MKYFTQLPKLRSIAIKFSLVLAGLAMLMPHTAQATRSLEAFGVDTVAGYSALLSTNSSTPDTPVEFHVLKPDSSELFLSAKTDPSGIARTDLYGYHTRQAGEYKVAVRPANQSDFSNYNSFEVFPDKVSDSQSNITASNQNISANGVEQTFITVELKDQYNNPLSDRIVQLISSRSGDQIQKSSGQTGTDQDGKITFTVTSEKPGVSTFSALDTTSGLILAARAKVVFTKPLPAVERTVNQALNASFIQTASAQDVTGPVSRLAIKQLPQTLPANETATFSVEALDNEENLVTNYQGTVFFSTTDPEATIPQRYTFTPEDLGSHEFELAVRFLTPGTHTLEVIDKDDESIHGSQEVIVTEAAGPDDEIILTEPSEGTYTTTTLTLAGTAPALTKIELYDGRRKLQTVGSTSDGEFSYTVSDLAEGTHSFSAQTVDGQNVSETVYIDIDLSGAQIETVYIEPKDPLVVNTSFTLYVETEPELPGVRAIFDDSSYTLTESTDTPGTYTVEMATPEDPGNYPIDITIEDELGNPTEEKDAYTVEVIADQRFARVFGVVATPGDEIVDLTWSETPKAESYRVEYSTEPGNYLDSFTTPTNSAKVIDLVNGKTYFFVVTALDEDGEDLTDNPSEEVSATPVGPQPVLNLSAEPADTEVGLSWVTYQDATNYRVHFGHEPGNYFDNFTTADAGTSATVYDLLNGTKYYFMVEALANGEVISTPSNEVSATPISPITCIPAEVADLTAQSHENGSVTLEWSAATDSNRYAIYAGEDPDNLELLEYAENTTTWTGDFADGTYYFAVKTVCPELTEEPVDFERIIKVEVGAGLIISIFLSMLIFAAAWRLRLIPHHANVRTSRREIKNVLEHDEYDIFQ